MPISVHRTHRAAIALAAAVLVAVPAGAAAKDKHKDGGAGAGHGAQTASTPCSILTPGVAPGVIAARGRYTVTPSGNGTLVCHGRVPAGPRRAIRVDGLQCPTPAGPTTRSHTVIAPSGRVTLTCHVKA